MTDKIIKISNSQNQLLSILFSPRGTVILKPELQDILSLTSRCTITHFITLPSLPFLIDVDFSRYQSSDPPRQQNQHWMGHFRGNSIEVMTAQSPAWNQWPCIVSKYAPRGVSTKVWNNNFSRFHGALINVVRNKGCCLESKHSAVAIIKTENISITSRMCLVSAVTIYEQGHPGLSELGPHAVSMFSQVITMMSLKVFNSRVYPSLDSRITAPCMHHAVPHSSPLTQPCLFALPRDNTQPAGLSSFPSSLPTKLTSWLCRNGSCITDHDWTDWLESW